MVMPSLHEQKQNPVRQKGASFMFIQKKHITGVSSTALGAALAARISIAAFLKSMKICLLAGALLIPVATLATSDSGTVLNVDLSRGTVQAPISVLGNADTWHYSLQTDQPSDIIVQHAERAPHGWSGWHSHPGPVLFTVTKGTATWYRANGPDCKPVVLPAGTTIVEPAGVVHTVQNESDTEYFETINTYILPAGAVRRTDEQNPGGACSDLP
jgi:quercetin dioxygenase-like cupin family protein